MYSMSSTLTPILLLQLTQTPFIRHGPISHAPAAILIGKKSMRFVKRPICFFSRRHGAARRLVQTAAMWFTILFCAVTAARAQKNGAEIIGAVKDSSGGALPGVTIVAERQAVGFRLERVTDDSGK